MMVEDPNDSEKYEEIFMTNEEVYNILKEEVFGISMTCSLYQLGILD